MCFCRFVTRNFRYRKVHPRLIYIEFCIFSSSSSCIISISLSVH